MSQITFSEPTLDDGKKIYELVKNNPPLDVNSEYAYLLLCHNFANTCVVAKSDSKIVGFISAFIPPNEKNTLFIWQAAVRPSFRGERLASRMLYSILQRDFCKSVEFIQATLAPSNQSSYSFLISVAHDLVTTFSKNPLFTKNKFSGKNHEKEDLITIGPFSTSRLQVVAQ